MEGITDLLQPFCTSCATQLLEPYIECAECQDVHLCCLCFSKGVELRQHKSNHSYAVRKNNFHLFENCNWTAKDEYNLLKYVYEHGYGNWEEISKSMQTHSKLECQEHYKKFYVENIQSDELPYLGKDEYNIEENMHPFLLRDCTSDDPLRHVSSTVSQQVAGYNPYRSDFEMNFDNNAESVLSLQSIHENENDELMKSLQCSLVMAYNNKLKERRRRYNIIRQHGLIVIRKFYKWIQQFEDTIGRPTCERLVTFMQLLTGIQFDTFMERFSMEKELVLYLHRLHDYRKNGMKTFKGCNLYRHLKRKEERYSKDLKNYLNSTELDWKSLSENSNSMFSNKDVNLLFNPLSRELVGPGVKARRGTAPLEIISLPGYEQLNDKEKTLCSALRLVPTNFITFRDLLITENNKNGCLRLLDARRLIKIDVNKTRKLYDYLISEGFIHKPA